MMNIEGIPESERLATLAELDRAHPGSSNRVAGVLAGPATEGRPDVPAWDYLKYTAAHPDVSLSQLAAIRFPVVFFGGSDFTIRSVDEFLHDPSTPLSGVETVESIIDMWQAVYAAGVVVWNSSLRAVEMVKPLAEYTQVLRNWDETRWPRIS